MVSRLLAVIQDANKMADERPKNVFVRFINDLAYFTSGTSSNTEELGGRLLALVREPPVCETGSEKLAKIWKLVQKGAPVDCRARETNCTPLQLACLSSDFFAVQALVKLGAGVNIRESQNSTPLHLACRRGSYEVCKLLLLHGADVNIQNSFGETPLHGAATQRSPQTIQLLLDHGASSTIKANSLPSYLGQLPETPFGFAIRCGLLENIMVFLRNGDSFKDFNAPFFLIRAHFNRINHKAAKCFIEAGIHRSGLVSDYRAYEERFMNWPCELRALLTQPRSLGGFCVQKIRQVLGQKNFFRKVCSLTIPETLQNKVLYWDFDKIEQGNSNIPSIYDRPVPNCCNHL